MPKQQSGAHPHQVHATARKQARKAEKLARLQAMSAESGLSVGELRQLDALEGDQIRNRSLAMAMARQEESRRQLNARRRRWFA